MRSRSWKSTKILPRGSDFPASLAAMTIESLRRLLADDKQPSLGRALIATPSISGEKLQIPVGFFKSNSPAQAYRDSCILVRHRSHGS